MKIKALYLQPEKLICPEVIEIDDGDGNLDELYRLLNCSTIDVTYRFFFNKTFCVIVDDVGALKNDRIVSAFRISSKGPSPDLFGNVIITGYPTDEGYFTSLSVDDVKTILSTLVSYKCANGVERYAFLLPM